MPRSPPQATGADQHGIALAALGHGGQGGDHGAQGNIGFIGNAGVLHQGDGWGGRLMDTAMDWLERDGPRTLWVGVWSENTGAQRFYARRGFVPVGEYLFHVGEARDREFILRRPAAHRP